MNINQISSHRNMYLYVIHIYVKKHSLQRCILRRHESNQNKKMYRLIGITYSLTSADTDPMSFTKPTNSNVT